MCADSDYSLFHSRMGRHRDNFNCGDAADAFLRGKDVFAASAGHSVSATGCSQVPLSDVLVYSEGDMSMDVCLTFPLSLTEEDIMNRDSYVCHPKFRIPCGPGTLFVFSFIDDLHFCHEACISGDGAGGGSLVLDDAVANSGCRVAFAFRWLQLVSQFVASSDRGKHAMKLNSEQRCHEEELVKKKKKKKKNNR